MRTPCGNSASRELCARSDLRVRSASGDTRASGSMDERVPIVYIVDDDEVTRSYYDAVLSKANVRCCRVESAWSFLEMHHPDQPGCLLLDVQMPGMTGPELQHELNLRGAIIPVI